MKISARFHRRVDVGICDNKKIANKYNASFGGIILLEYNYSTG
jgi:hypothetical protein